MEKDTENTDFIVCPHCGYEDRDSWDVDFNNNETTYIECGDCGKEMFVERCVSVTYSSYKPSSKRKRL